MNPMRLDDMFLLNSSTSRMDQAKGVLERQSGSSLRSKDGAAFEGILKEKIHESPASKDGSENSKAEVKPSKAEHKEVKAEKAKAEIPRKSSEEESAERSEAEGCVASPEGMQEQAKKASVSVEPIASLQLNEGVMEQKENLSKEILPLLESESIGQKEEIILPLENESKVSGMEFEISQTPVDTASLDPVKDLVKDPIKDPMKDPISSPARKESSELSPLVAGEPKPSSLPHSETSSESFQDSSLNSSEKGLPALKRNDGNEKTMTLRNFTDELFVHRQLLETSAKAEAPKTAEATLLLSDSIPTVKNQVLTEMGPMISRLKMDPQGGEMTIQLRPISMGTVKVDIQVVEDSVKVHFQTENVGARMNLQSQSQDLKNHLQAAGLKVDQMQFSNLPMNEGSRQEDANSNRQQQNHQQSQHQQQAQNSPSRDQSSDSKSEAKNAFWKIMDESATEVRL